MNDKMVHRAQKLLAGFKCCSSADHKKLREMVRGKVKSVGPEWWRKINDKANKPKLDKIRAMADPARNPSEPQRRVAEAMSAKEQATSPPGLEEYERQMEEIWMETQRNFDPQLRAMFEEFASSLDSVNTSKAEP